VMQKILAAQNISHYDVLIVIDYHCQTLGMECEATPGEAHKDQLHIHSTTEHESQRAWPEVTLPAAETTKNIVNLADNAPPRM